MLIVCPECNLNVSDKASSCPHCGYPMMDERASPKPSSTRRRGSKRKRLPNGFGQISQIKGKALRKPFRAMVCVGKREDGRPIVKPLKPVTYFETYNDAYAALLEYHRNPFDASKDITMGELYFRWSSDHFKTLKSKTSAQNIESMWKHCSRLYGVKVRDMRSANIKEFLEHLETTDGNKHVIRLILNMMFDYALEYEIVDHNYARNITTSYKSSTPVTGSHETYTDAEVDEILKRQGDKIYDMVLVQCYTGFRPQELCLLELENINLEERTIIGGMKTVSGRNRVVPIHGKILGIVSRWYHTSQDSGCKYLFSDISYGAYRAAFPRKINKLELETRHRPHDGRVRFVTEAKKAGVDEYAIKLIVGHSISDLTERVYTKRDTSWLLSEIEKIP